MHVRTLLAGLLLPAAATAQRLDLGLTGGTRLSFTDAVFAAGQAEPNARGRAQSAAGGVEAAYTFRSERLRLSTGLLRGELAQAFDPSIADGKNLLTLRTPTWQVPLRLHVPLLRLGSQLTAGLRTGLVLQLQARQRLPRVGGDYRTAAYVAEYNALALTREGSLEAPYQLFPAASRKSSALLLETGAELSYALTPALALDLSAAYQAGLRQIEAPALYRLDLDQRPRQHVLTASTKGSNLLVALGARYALKSWAGASGN